MPNAPADPIERLYDYTKFHIGLYAALVTALVAVIRVDNLAVPPEYHLFLGVTIVCFLTAGAAGGTIASNAAERNSLDDLRRNPPESWFTSFLRWRRLPSRLRLKRLPSLRFWVGLEHIAFWIGICVAVVGLAFVER